MPGPAMDEPTWSFETTRTRLRGTAAIGRAGYSRGRDGRPRRGDARPLARGRRAGAARGVPRRGAGGRPRADGVLRLARVRRHPAPAAGLATAATAPRRRSRLPRRAARAGAAEPD